MQNIHLLKFLSEWCNVHHFQCMAVPVELKPSIENGDIASAKTQGSGDLAEWNESNNKVYHIKN